MLRNLLRTGRREDAVDAVAARADWSLQFALWLLWTLAIVAVGYFNWQADVVAQRPVNMLGLVIHCMTVGIIGLVVMTKIEMWLQPERFLD